MLDFFKQSNRKDCDGDPPKQESEQIKWVIQLPRVRGSENQKNANPPTSKHLLRRYDWTPKNIPKTLNLTRYDWMSIGNVLRRSVQSSTGGLMVILKVTLVFFVDCSGFPFPHSKHAEVEVPQLLQCLQTRCLGPQGSVGLKKISTQLLVPALLLSSYHTLNNWASYVMWESLRC